MTDKELLTLAAKAAAGYRRPYCGRIFAPEADITSDKCAALIGKSMS